MEAGRRRFTEELPNGWPEKDLWLTTVDIVSGRRSVLGRGSHNICKPCKRFRGDMPCVQAPMALLGDSPPTVTTIRS